MEDLVTGAAQVKSTGLATLRDTRCVDTRANNGDSASECVKVKVCFNFVLVGPNSDHDKGYDDR